MFVNKDLQAEHCLFTA